LQQLLETSRRKINKKILLPAVLALVLLAPVLAVARAAVLALGLPAPVLAVARAAVLAPALPAPVLAVVARVAVLAPGLLAPVLALRRWCTWCLFRGLPALTAAKPAVLLASCFWLHCAPLLVASVYLALQSLYLHYIPVQSHPQTQLGSLFGPAAGWAAAMDPSFVYERVAGGELRMGARAHGHGGPGRRCVGDACPVVYLFGDKKEKRAVLPDTHNSRCSCSPLPPPQTHLVLSLSP
jgi:hypothetical protein